MKKSLSKCLFLLVFCSLFFSSCKVCKNLGESLGIINDDPQTEKVINGKVVKVNSDGKLVPSSSNHKINIGYLVWWAAVFTAIALGVRHYIRKRHE